MRRLLGIEGYTAIATTSDPTKTAELYTAIEPDLVLLDLHMRPIGGLAVLEALAKIAGGAYLPVLVMTGSDDPGALERAYELGARDFLRKPFDRIEARARVRGVLECSVLRRRVRELEAR
jgi:putative two-component system response regulator